MIAPLKITLNFNTSFINYFLDPINFENVKMIQPGTQLIVQDNSGALIGMYYSF